MDTPSSSQSNFDHSNQLHRRPTTLSPSISPRSPSSEATSSSLKRKRHRLYRGQYAWLRIKPLRYLLLVPILCFSVAAFIAFEKQRIDYSRDISELLRLSENFEQEWPESSFIHIVNTRFMQEQGKLATLGMARYHQFATFCLPTMLQQTSQDFFWIIKTDPALDPKILNLMISAVQPHTNIYLVGSNNNFLINKKNGSWRDGSEGWDLIKSKIFTGNITKLHQAIALRNKRTILETRLDADDG